MVPMGTSSDAGWQVRLFLHLPLETTSREMPMVTAPQPELAVTDVAWSERLGDLARAIGTEPFYERLLSLFGSLIGHDSAWIIRYSRVATPDVRFTRNVPRHVLDIYESTFFAVDPFFRFWAEISRPGVVLLRDVLTDDNELYREGFQSKAGFLDEMALFFPVIGHSGLALFVQRSAVPFSDEDRAKAQHIFPALEGIHRAHVGRLFYELRYRSDNADRSLIQAPTLIVDRCGTPAYVSPAWRDAEQKLPDLRGVVASWHHDEKRRTLTSLDVGPNHQIRIEAFDRDFQLAPEGFMLILEQASKLNDKVAAALEKLELTSRERDILTLTVQGKTTGEIAQALAISKGTIKNHRLRMYRKLNVTSERALLGMLMPLIDGDGARAHNGVGQSRH
ncbi:Response regulator receiver protein [Beijerinckiaceae bacterium RH AL1]|jgi:DNA-binding CsgD family transcriptional regulator|nr:Response regulator receiver protein [Beijerinckiaceae bacterium RH CH11]VVB49436.1 Response regulator receiver protein [Beijerinckiaceae bacterium RH AL8]VVC56861.1 Response regulator receiver protein [Beijerinckiaceae bacterium RH AL1]